MVGRQPGKINSPSYKNDCVASKEQNETTTDFKRLLEMTMEW